MGLRELLILTDSFVSRVKQLCQWCGGPFLLNHFSPFLILGDLTEHTGSNTLDVVHGGEQKLKREGIAEMAFIS